MGALSGSLRSKRSDWRVSWQDKVRPQTHQPPQAPSRQTQRAALGGEAVRVFKPGGADDVEFFHGSFHRRVFQRHAHPHHYSLAITPKGEMNVEVGPRNFVLRPGMVSLVEPRVGHAGKSAGEGPYQFLTMHFSRSFLQKHIGPVPSFSFAPLYDEQAFELANRIGTMIAADRQAELGGLFESLIARFIDKGGIDRDREPVHPAVLTSFDLFEDIETDFKEASLDYIAERVSLHPVYLSRLFRQATGLPPHSYLNSFRLQIAKNRLRAGVGLADIAADLGFADQSHLTRLFKRSFGITPGAYARQLS